MKVFKNLRKKLIEDKKIRSYIPYAIGEIILVVIGILIALAINNANLRSIKSQKERVYLEGLHKEFSTSKSKLSELIQVNKNNYEGAKKIVKYMDQSSLTVSEKELSHHLFTSLAFDISFNPNNSLLLEMMSSASLKDLSNSELRVRLTNWLSTLEDITNQEADLRVQREKILDIFRNQYSIRTVFDQAGVSENEIGIGLKKNFKSNLALLNSLEFENNLLLFILTSIATEKSHYQPLMIELEIILSLLEREIGS
ncbi:DUF6090 family protein [Ekhidna sp.]|uniref:DUF6090 family protein n=1 Tax=Ekhidna sp. TaxID=2608089 RepID=UPI0035184423